MNETSELPKEKLKLLFSDLLKGYSTANYRNQSIIVKHLTHFDVADFDIKYNDYFETARLKGAETIKEREDFLIREGSWSPQKDKEIKDNISFINGLRETKSKLFRQSEIEQINKTIKESEEKIGVLEDEKNQLLQYTAESFASKKIVEYQIFKSLLLLNQTPLFTEEEYDQLTDHELLEIAKIYNEKFTYFNENNFKRIALSNFFLNSFYLCKDNPFTFYGKPIIQLTLFQIDVFSHAVYFKHLLSNAPSKPPPEIMENPDKLIDWSNASKSVKEQLDKGKKPEDLVGLTQKDRDALGIQSNNMHNKLVEAAKKKGSPLTAADIMKIQGINMG